jgi:hypothetical protein
MKLANKSSATSRKVTSESSELAMQGELLHLESTALAGPHLFPLAEPSRDVSPLLYRSFI